MLSNVIGFILGFCGIVILASTGIAFTIFSTQTQAHFLMAFAIPIDVIYSIVILLIIKILFSELVS